MTTSQHSVQSRCRKGMVRC